MRVAHEQQMKGYRAIFDLLNHDPRIQYNKIAEIIGVDGRTASNRLREAVEKGIIVGPQVRKKSFSNFRTYVYLSQVQDPLELFDQYTRNKDVIYHELLDGVFNLHVISKEKLDIEGVVLEGIPSDYYISYPPDRPWGRAIDTMRTMVAWFNPEEYVPKGYITTHWDEPVNWSDTDEILYQEFKYDLRKPLEPLVKDKYHIWSGNGYDFLKRLPHACTAITCYFPETARAYDPHLFLVGTEYEDFVIEVFSQLPTTCWFQRVSDALMVNVWTLKRPLYQANVLIDNVAVLQIPLLLRELVKKGIVRKEERAEIKWHWRKEANEISTACFP